jgi:hypothetical protein
MNSKEQNKEDLLKQYINPERIEKAPEGFTSKVMSRIQVEPVPLRSANKIGNKSLIPFISIAVTILFFLAALLIPGGESDALTFPGLRLFNDIKVSLPKIDITYILSISLPASFIYIVVTILILTLFDRALNIFFHRER